MFRRTRAFPSPPSRDTSLERGVFVARKNESNNNYFESLVSSFDLKVCYRRGPLFGEKKIAPKICFSCRGGKKKRERERAVDTRVFATRKRRRRKGRGNQPSSSRPFRRREIRAASIVPSTALARVFSLYFVSNLSPYRRIKSIFFIPREKTPTLKKQKKNNRDPKYIKQKENFEKFNTILEKTKGG